MHSALSSLFRPFSFDGWEIKPAQSCTWAEDNAAIHDKAAIAFELDGNLAAAGRARGEAAWWRALPTLEAKELQSIYRSCESETMDSIHVLLEGAKNSESAFLALTGILYAALEGVYALADSGDKRAASLLLHIVTRGSEIVAGMGWNKPELISSIAEKAFGLPLIVSPNLEKQKDNARLLKFLKVGSAFKLSIAPTGKRGRHWRFQNRANGLAVRLVSHIESQVIFYNIVRIDPAARIPGWLVTAAELRPFGADTWKEWFKIAWEGVLAESSPNGKPGEHPAFYDPETRICEPRDNRAKGLLPSGRPKVIHGKYLQAEHIKRTLREAFEVVATGRSPRTKG